MPVISERLNCLLKALFLTVVSKTDKSIHQFDGEERTKMNSTTFETIPLTETILKI